MSYFSEKILSFLCTQINCQWKNGFCGIVERLYGHAVKQNIFSMRYLYLLKSSQSYSGKIFVEMQYSELISLFYFRRSFK